MLRASVFANSCCPPSRNYSGLPLSRLLGALGAAKSHLKLFPGHLKSFSQHFQDVLGQFSRAPGIPCICSHFSSWSFGLSAFFLVCGIALPLVFPFYQHTSYKTLYFRFPNQWRSPKIPVSTPKMGVATPRFHPVTAVDFKTWNAELQELDQNPPFLPFFFVVVVYSN